MSYSAFLWKYEVVEVTFATLPKQLFSVTLLPQLITISFVHLL